MRRTRDERETNAALASNSNSLRAVVLQPVPVAPWTECGTQQASKLPRTMVKSSTSGKDEMDPTKQRVQVFVRVKPHLETDSPLLPPCVGVGEGEGGVIPKRLHLEKPSRQGGPATSRPFIFDGVLGQSATQSDVYRVVALPIVDDVLEGYNGTILAYGQTGAGKTHTLSSIQPGSIGIVPRAAQDLFDRAVAGGNRAIEVKLSYLQIYCEQIQDLLKPETGDNLSIRELKDVGGARVGVPELQEMVVTCLDDCLRLIQLGDRNRSVAFTALNAHSSRSHAVIIFTVTTVREQKQRTGRLYVVDLAGSERLKKSKSVAQRAVEARAINLSLTTLGKCVNARATGQQHVPFRDSKLTRLLQESLGGNAKTSMIVAVRGTGDHAEETHQSLEFGSRAMQVQTHAEVNVEEAPFGTPGSCAPPAAQATHALAQLQQLQRQNAQVFRELKEDQDRSLRAIKSLQKEKEAMRREARRLRDVHNEQLGTERLEKDAYRTMALRAEQRAVEAELSASKSESKVAELREQLDRAMEQLEVLETLHDAYSSKDPRDQHDQHDQHDLRDGKRRQQEDEAAKLEALQHKHDALAHAHAVLQEELSTARREITKYKKRAKEAVFKLDILNRHRRRVEIEARAATAIQRAYRAHRARQQRSKIQQLVSTKDALGNLAAKHAAGEHVLGESLEVVHKAVEGILGTFLLHGDKLDAVLNDKMKRPDAKHGTQPTRDSRDTRDTRDSSGMNRNM